MESSYLEDEAVDRRIIPRELKLEYNLVWSGTEYGPIVSNIVVFRNNRTFLGNLMIINWPKTSLSKRTSWFHGFSGGEVPSKKLRSLLFWVHHTFDYLVLYFVSVVITVRFQSVKKRKLRLTLA
jgi:hypothetical protein